ncbi:cysteine desulfurase DndA [Streptomyces sp. SID8366]|uniref:cysteine desulfurase DndA n=1 Tax=unclassified Streptomyces TaxID=2593676 RepID=UPI000DB965FF|nr:MULTISPECIES: cysteine desulfurase DndA [unclassified Streptomyces]MYU08364.1 cysteine desulfurase DndA [Streptomyces sp. SID8366]MYU67054.1 cysteine desulfurase DndA [Streptomyces sp. SID69]
MVTYLDAAATTRVDPRVAEVVLHWMTEEFGNAGSRTHEYGTRAKRAVQQSRQHLAGTFNADPDELIFTSGATESNNIALLGLAAHGEATGRRHIITSAVEHKAVIEPLEHLQTRGFEVDFIEPGASGRVTVEAVMERLRPDTLLVSLMHVNNETGVVQPVAELASKIRETETFFHVDAAQGYGKLTQDLTAPIDLISVSGHKIGGPKGIGMLLARHRGWDTIPLKPIMFGGGQERGLRPGTLPVPLIMGLAEAAKLFHKEHARWLKEASAFRDRLLEALGKIRFTVNGDQEHTVPHILNLSFDGVDAEALIVMLKDQVAVATGSACTSASYTPSHVLTAMGLPAEVASNGLRLSWFPSQTTELNPADLVETIKRLQPDTA